MVPATLQSFAGFKYGKMNTAEKCPVRSDNKKCWSFLTRAKIEDYVGCMVFLRETEKSRCPSNRIGDIKSFVVGLISENNHL